jgi:ABC-type branched-subunit amino acid transport system ATPase component
MSDSYAVEARGLVKRYGSTIALDGIDLEIPTGTATAVLGPNGAGKTTAVPHPMAYSIIWIMGLVAVCAPLAVRAYQRSIDR